MKPHPSLLDGVRRANWQRVRQQKADEAARKRRIEAQNLEMILEGLQPLVLCEECHGRGCGACRNQGVVERPTELVECPRCYGVGRVATVYYEVRRCVGCRGTGKVCR